MKSIQQGFTLIELMIVIAIIAILAAIAIPTYQTYIVKAQVSEGMSLAGPVQQGVALYYTNHGNLNGITNNSDVGASKATSIGGKYVASVAVQNGGNVLITYGTGSGTGFGSQVNSKIKSDTLLLSVVPSVGAVNWTCKTGTSQGVPAKYLPSSCR